jgi:hypothetical protein
MIEVKKTIPTFSTIGLITKLQEFVLLPSVGLIGQLELLLMRKNLWKHVIVLINLNYEQLVRLDVFKEKYIPENVSGDLHYGDRKEDRRNLKDETITWIIKYANNPMSAVSLACYAVNEMKYFKKRVSLFYQTNDENKFEKERNPSGKKRRTMVSDLKSILQNTKYADLYEMLIKAHFITTKKGKSFMDNHSNDDSFVEVGKVIVEVPPTEMPVNEEVIVGKKDGIPSTASEGQSAKILVDHCNDDFVEVGKVNVGVPPTEMLVNEEVIVGKKDGIPSTASEGLVENNSVPSTASEDPTPIQNRMLTKDAVLCTALQDQYAEIMFIVQEAMKAYYNEDEVIVGKETLAEAGEHPTASDNQSKERVVVQQERKAKDGVPPTEMIVNNSTKAKAGVPPTETIVNDSVLIVEKETLPASVDQSAEMLVLEQETTMAKDYTPEAYQKNSRLLKRLHRWRLRITLLPQKEHRTPFKIKKEKSRQKKPLTYLEKEN